MKLKLGSFLLDPRTGKPVKMEGEDRNATIGGILIAALLLSAEGEKDGKAKYERWKLVQRIEKAEGEVVELSVDEAKLIKDHAALFLAPMLLGPVWDAIEDAGKTAMPLPE